MVFGEYKGYLDTSSDRSGAITIVSGVPNDDTKAVRFLNVSKGTVLKLYDASDQSADDDYCIITGRSGGPILRGWNCCPTREIEVFQLVGRGLTSREIAGQLNLGPTTVDSYRARIKEKLAIRNAAELYQRAAQWVAERRL